MDGVVVRFFPSRAPCALAPVARGREMLSGRVFFWLPLCWVGVGGLGKSDGRGKRRRATPGPSMRIRSMVDWASRPKASSNNSGTVDRETYRRLRVFTRCLVFF
jgi:hypothetical protein